MFAVLSILGDYEGTLGGLGQASGVMALFFGGIGLLLGILAFRGVDPSSRLYNAIAVALGTIGFGVGLYQTLTCV